MAEHIRPFWIALAFLTTLPTPGLGKWSEADPRRAVVAYPLVGLVLGLLLWVAAAAIELLGGLPPLVRGALLAGLLLLLTGGLHFDGLCDSADAALAPRSRQERRLIAADPRIGSFALATGALLLIVKSAALGSVPAESLAAVPLLARTTAVFPMVWAHPPAGSRLAEATRPRGSEPLQALLLGTLITVTFAAVSGNLLFWAMMIAIALLIALFGANWLTSRLGGIGGDGYGALIESTEAGLLVLLLAA